MSGVRLEPNRHRALLGIVVALCALSAGCTGYIGGGFSAEGGVADADLEAGAGGSQGGAAGSQGGASASGGAGGSQGGAGGSPAAGGSAGSPVFGKPCRGYDDCAPVSGKVVDCYCNRQHPAPVCVTEAEVGESCAFAPCRQGTTCIGLNNATAVTCHPLGKLGEPCGLSCAGKPTCFVACDDPYYCNQSGLCAVGQADLGAPCTAPWECIAPYYCSGSTCAIPQLVGASCPAASWPAKRSPCLDGVCSVPNAAGQSVCVQVQPDGAPCAHPNECASEVCFSGRCGLGLLPDGGVLSCTSL
jgi:hypothetical protein